MAEQLDLRDDRAKQSPSPPDVAADTGRRYRLPARAIRLLRELLARADAEGRCGHLTEAALAKATGDSPVTVGRAAKDLETVGAVTARWQRGQPKSYRVRWESLASGPPEGVTQVTAGSDLGHLPTGDLGHPPEPVPAEVHGAGEVTSAGALGPPPHTIPPQDGKMERSIDQSGGDPGHPQVDLSTLPRGCWVEAEGELPALLRRWCDRHELAAADLPGGRGRLGLLAAVLAARDVLREGRLRSATGYVVACLRRGISDGYLARAERLLSGERTRSPPAYSPHGLPRDDSQVRAARRRGE